MNSFYKKIRMSSMSGIVFLTIPQLLLIVVLVGLLVLLVTTCIKFTKGPSSTIALEKNLLQLQSKFASSTAIDPEEERQKMEKLQNKIKTSTDPSTISANQDLQQLFANNCTYIQSALTDVNLANRSSWIKFKELMFGFNKFYFPA